MPDPIRTSERWDEWVNRQRADSDSCAGQLMRVGIPLETALIINMLGRIHEELVSIAEALGQSADGEDWRE
jgi:hypothetical protein